MGYNLSIPPLLRVKSNLIQTLLFLYYTTLYADNRAIIEQFETKVTKNKFTQQKCIQVKT